MEAPRYSGRVGLLPATLLLAAVWAAPGGTSYHSASNQLSRGGLLVCGQPKRPSDANLWSDATCGARRARLAGIGSQIRTRLSLRGGEAPFMGSGMYQAKPVAPWDRPEEPETKKSVFADWSRDESSDSTDPSAFDVPTCLGPDVMQDPRHSRHPR